MQEVMEIEKSVTQVTNGPKGISLNAIISLWQEGKKDEEIAKRLGCSRVNVFKRLQPIRDELIASQECSDEGEILRAAIEKKFAFELLTRDLKSMKVWDVAKIWGTAVDKGSENKQIVNNYFQQVIVDSFNKPIQKESLVCQTSDNEHK